MSLGGKMFGAGRERIPNIAFRMMSLTMKVHDLFKEVDTLIEDFGIEEGYTVVDYGCGPGRYVQKASFLVGPTGRIYAADIHKLAMEKVQNLMKKHNLGNVTPVLINCYSSAIEGNAADVVYALDMFHMIKEPNSLLAELNRLTKTDGFLFIDDGHQSRTATIDKITGSGLWEIVDEKKRYLQCKPIKE